jgi:hypothetical protein
VKEFYFTNFTKETVVCEQSCFSRRKKKKKKKKENNKELVCCSLTLSVGFAQEKGEANRGLDIDRERRATKKRRRRRSHG